jgi:hypothetical protein
MTTWASLELGVAVKQDRAMAKALAPAIERLDMYLTVLGAVSFNRELAVVAPRAGSRGPASWQLWPLEPANVPP